MSAVSGIPLLSAATAGMTGTWVGRLSEKALWSPLTSMWPVTTVSAIFFTWILSKVRVSTPAVPVPWIS